MQYGSFGDCDLCVVSGVDVDGVLDKDGYVIGFCVLARAKKGMLADAWRDMEFIGGKGVLHCFRGCDNCSTRQNELLGRFASRALTWISGSAHSSGGSTVGDS